MKHFFNVLRFIIFLPICMGVLYGLYWLLGFLLRWFWDFSTGWMVVALILLFMFGGMIGSYLSGLAAYCVMYITPYKKISAFILSLITIIYGTIQIWLIWKSIDFEYTRHWVVAISVTLVAIFISFGFVFGAYVTKEPE